jgi:hypothetical protein
LMLGFHSSRCRELALAGVLPAFLAVQTGCSTEGASGGAQGFGGVTTSSGGLASGGQPSSGGSSQSGGNSTSGGTASGGSSNGGSVNATGGSAGTTPTAGAGGSALGGAGSLSGGSPGSGGTAGSPNGGSPGSGGTPGGASGGSGGGSCAVGTSGTLTNINKGSIAKGSQVRLTGVVATSPKFLLSKGSSGACYWSVFVSEPVSQAVEYSGGLLVANGARAAVVNGAVGDCPTGTDVLPEDTKPGDVFDVSASVDSYVRSDCATTTVPPPTPEIRLDICSAQRTGTGRAVPNPATIANVAEITNSGDDAAHRKWIGVLVKLSNVTGVDVSTTTGPVGSTGTIRFTNGARARDRIYQGKQTAVFSPQTTWSSVTGLVHLDVCQWSVEPRSPCTDFVPKSLNCP